MDTTHSAADTPARASLWSVADETTATQEAPLRLLEGGPKLARRRSISLRVALPPRHPGGKSAIDASHPFYWARVPTLRRPAIPWIAAWLNSSRRRTHWSSRAFPTAGRHGHRRDRRTPSPP